MVASVTGPAGRTDATRRLRRTVPVVRKAELAAGAGCGLQTLPCTPQAFGRTEAGETCLEGCRKVLATGAAMEDRLAAYRDRPTGRLRVSVPLAPERMHVVPASCGFLERHTASKSRRCSSASPSTRSRGAWMWRSRALPPTTRVWCSAPRVFLPCASLQVWPTWNGGEPRVVLATSKRAGTSASACFRRTPTGRRLGGTSSPTADGLRAR